MPLLGFRDNKGNKIDFRCVNQTAPEQWNMPLTYVKSMALTANREAYCDYSASELSSVTVQQYLLLKQNDIYIQPDRLLDRWEGTMHHKALAQVENGSSAEVPLTMTIDDVTIGGTPDYYDNGLLLDYKTCKQYQPGWIDKAGGIINDISKGEWYHQLNIYRVLCKYNGMPVKEMQVSMYIKDWSYRSKCKKIETREVAFDGHIIDWIRHKVRLIQIHERESILPACSDTNRWKDNLRCEHYCDVSDICTQNPTHAF